MLVIKRLLNLSQLVSFREFKDVIKTGNRPSSEVLSDPILMPLYILLQTLIYRECLFQLKSYSIDQDY